MDGVKVEDYETNQKVQKQNRISMVTSFKTKQNKNPTLIVTVSVHFIHTRVHLGVCMQRLKEDVKVPFFIAPCSVALRQESHRTWSLHYLLWFWVVLCCVVKKGSLSIVLDVLELAT